MDTHKDQSTSSLLSNIVNQISALFRSELDLARSEIDEKLHSVGLALGLIVAAVVLFLTALNVLAAALSAGLTELGLEPGWAALIVGVVFAVIGWVMLAKGMRDLKLSSLAPNRTVDNIKRDANAVKGT